MTMSKLTMANTGSRRTTAAVEDRNTVLDWCTASAELFIVVILFLFIFAVSVEITVSRGDSFARCPTEFP